MKMPKTLTPWGMRVFRYIEARGWSLNTVEDKSGIRKATILRWMQGRNLPRLDDWIVLCDALAKNEEDFNQIIESTMESIVEYQLATTRYRRRAEKQQNKQ